MNKIASNEPSGFAQIVQVLDWESQIPSSRSVRHDPRMPLLANSPGFTESMSRGWGSPSRLPKLTSGMAQAAKSHRQRLSEALPGQILVITAGRSQLRVGDTFFPFRANSDFLWLAGYSIEDAVLVMTPTSTGHDAILYMIAPARPGDKAFYADAHHGELWVGPAPGLAELASALDLNTEVISALAVPDKALIAGASVVGPRAGAALSGKPRSLELTRGLSELRMIKDAWEIDELRTAVNNTVDGFIEVHKEIPRALNGGGERWLQGTFDRHARTVGQAPGYSTIVGSGPHAPILHWVDAAGEVNPADLLLLDMGVEAHSGYTADVTRTFPVNGTFSNEQRLVHDLVEKSHRAGLVAVRPGNLWADFHAACMEVLASGLFDWGLLPVSVDESLSSLGQQHRRYVVCGVGHHLGLDVHDCESSSYANYLGGTLEPGMTLTVEPGLYFHQWDETVPPEIRGIGIRIEDDLVVTNTGIEVLSSAIPIDAAGIETWMANNS